MLVDTLSFAVLDVSTGLELALCRCVPNLPSLGLLRALASLLNGEVALLGGLLDSDESLSSLLRILSFLLLVMSTAGSVAASICTF